MTRCPLRRRLQRDLEGVVAKCHSDPYRFETEWLEVKTTAVYGGRLARRE